MKYSLGCENLAYHSLPAMLGMHHEYPPPLDSLIYSSTCSFNPDDVVAGPTAGASIASPPPPSMPTPKPLPSCTIKHFWTEHRVKVEPSHKCHTSLCERFHLTYRFWPLSPDPPPCLCRNGHLTNEQMYLRLGELPLYLSRSRSASDGGFKRMKEGYFKTQAVSTLVEEVRNGFTAAEIVCRGYFDKIMLK